VGLVVLAILFIAVLLWTFAIFPSAKQRPPGASAAETLPDLKLQALTGAQEPVKLADLSGKVVLVNLWGTWCGPCQEELPHLVKLHEKFAGRPDFQLLAVSCGPAFEPEDLGELRDSTRAFLEKRGYDMPTYADADLTTRRALLKVARFNGYPTTFLLDRQGRVQRVWSGFAAEPPAQAAQMQDVESWIQKLLDEPA
jgi:thiol-disulfide isomerase/thioredoxin